MVDIAIYYRKHWELNSPSNWYWPQEKTTTRTHEGNFCANFVPLAYKNRPHLGICGNSEDQSTCWYYYPCLLQSVPVYPLWKTSNLNVGSSSLSDRTSNINRLNIIHLFNSYVMLGLIWMWFEGFIVTAD